MWQSESYSCFLSIPTSARVKVNFRTGEKRLRTGEKRLELAKKDCPKTKVLVSLIIGRYDDGNLNDKGVLVNDKLMRELPRSDIIDNSNLDRQCVGLKGLHLNRLGNKHLALNFKQVLNGL